MIPRRFVRSRPLFPFSLHFFTCRLLSEPLSLFFYFLNAAYFNRRDMADKARKSIPTYADLLSTSRRRKPSIDDVTKKKKDATKKKSTTTKAKEPRPQTPPLPPPVGKTGGIPAYISKSPEAVRSADGVEVRDHHMRRLFQCSPLPHFRHPSLCLQNQIPSTIDPREKSREDQ